MCVSDRDLCEQSVYVLQLLTGVRLYLASEAGVKFRKIWNRIWKKFTFLLILLFTALILTLIGFAGENSIYSGYAIKPFSQPHLMLVFEGIHDGIYPWDLIVNRGGSGNGATMAGERGTQRAAEEEDTGAMTSQIAEADTGEDSEAQERSSAVKSSAAETGTDSEAASEEVTQDVSADAALPEGVCNPVMQAVDYGVANVSFLSPEDTVYNNDTEGIFARDGTYYKLQAVDSSYFEDALFIGDSRTVGLCEYGSLRGTAEFLAKESINVYYLLDHELDYTGADGTTASRTVEDVLDGKQYGKIYVDLGVNELGSGTTKTFYEKYREILSLIRDKQPEAIIFIQGIMHVDKALSSSDSSRNNTVIVQRNEAIATLANGRDIFYIDMNPYVCDENGDLKDDLSGDGVHLKASAYENWDRSLMENAIVRNSDDWAGYTSAARLPLLASQFDSQGVE